VITATAPAPAAAGPLKLPPPADADAHTAVRQLRGHTTAPGWLPAGLSPELDELRDEMARVRGRAQTDLDELEALRRKYRTEDRDHEAALKQAARAGSTAEDRRTPEGARLAAVDPIDERLWATVEVMGEVADKVVATLREQEPDLLADLRVQLRTAEDKKREAERLLREAKTDEWRVHRLGQWVLNSSEDGPFGRQPAPTPEPPPACFNREMLRDSLTRPWHKPIARTA
jgi:hypothetical protein